MRPMGAELFRTDRPIDMTKVLLAFRNFANSPKIELSAHTVCLCLLHVSENKQRLFFLYSISYMLFITQIPCVYCAVRANI